MAEPEVKSYMGEYNPEVWAKKTWEAVCEPKIGDRFNEMYSFWVYVIDVAPQYDRIVVATGCQEWDYRSYTLEGYKKWLQYGSENLKEKCWAYLTDRETERNFEHCEAFRKDFEEKFGISTQEYMRKSYVLKSKVEGEVNGPPTPPFRPKMRRPNWKWKDGTIRY